MASALGIVFTLALCISTTYSDEGCNPDSSPIHLAARDDCGVSRAVYTGSKIVGGRDAVEGEHPWQLSLQMRPFPLSSYRHICGASLINDKWAVTAAHCVPGGVLSNLRVVAGAHDFKSKSTRTTEHRVFWAYVHESYNQFASLKNDIALLRLATPVNITGSDGFVSGVCLPQASENATGMATVSGWGTSREGAGSTMTVLQTVDVPIITYEECEKAYSDNVDEEGMICAGYEEGGKDSCQGDSGGPLVQRSDDGKSTLIGIVSWGQGCARPGKPGVYTKTSHFINWMERIMNGP